MSSKTIFALIFLIIILSTNFAEAQDSTPIISPTDTTIPTPTVTTRPTIDPEILVLRAQLDQMRETDAQMQDIVLWSLGLVATLAVLIVGLNVYNTRVQYEKDKRLIRDEIMTELQKEIDEQLNDFTQDYDKALDDIFNNQRRDKRDINFNMRLLQAETIIEARSQKENTAPHHLSRLIHEALLLSRRAVEPENKKNRPWDEIDFQLWIDLIQISYERLREEGITLTADEIIKLEEIIKEIPTPFIEKYKRNLLSLIRTIRSLKPEEGKVTNSSPTTSQVNQNS